MIGLQRIKLAFGTDDQSRKIFPQKSASGRLGSINALDADDLRPQAQSQDRMTLADFEGPIPG